ncbi:MAG: type I secretion system permease/ATPase [Pseudooceanicola sp.]
MLRPVLTPVLLFSALLNLLMLTGSIYMLQVYDKVLTTGSVPTLLGLFAIVVVLYIFLGLYDLLRGRILARAALQLDRSLGDDAFRASLNGQAGLRDLETLRGGIASSVTKTVFDLPYVPLYLALLFLLHPWLGGATVAGAMIAGALAFLTRSLTTGAMRDAAGAEAAEREMTDTCHRAAETVAALGMEPRLAARWRKLRDSHLAAAQRGGDPAEALAAGSRAFRLLLQSTILTIGAWLVISGDISAGMIIASSILSGRALAPIDQLAGQWRMIGKTMAAWQRLSATLDNLPARPAPLDLPEPKGRLEVSGVSWLMPATPGTPEGAERPAVLSDISFNLEPGDGLGVLGASASGKTTLARLLVGALGSDRGEVRIDAATLDQWSPERRGRFIGYLPQHVLMLPGTIRDNIARFDPDAPDSEIVAAAQLAGVHEMILRLPEGYATPVATAGAPPLSGGQLQRLGLARAVYHRPALVVLDEPNSNLDGGGQAALNHAIQSLREGGATVVVIAHRPSVLNTMNKILILESGRLVAFGPKDEVLAKVVTTQSGQSGQSGQPGQAVQPGQSAKPAAAKSSPAQSGPGTVAARLAAARASAAKSAPGSADPGGIVAARRAAARGGAHVIPKQATSPGGTAG